MHFVKQNIRYKLRTINQRYRQEIRALYNLEQRQLSKVKEIVENYSDLPAEFADASSIVSV